MGLRLPRGDAGADLLQRPSRPAPSQGTGLADLTFSPNWPPKDLRRQRSRHGFDDPQIHADGATSDDPEADSDDELTD